MFQLLASHCRVVFKSSPRSFFTKRAARKRDPGCSAELFTVVPRSCPCAQFLIHPEYTHWLVEENHLPGYHLPGVYVS